MEIKGMDFERVKFENIEWQLHVSWIEIQLFWSLMSFDTKKRDKKKT
jgi:hypothetical protein